MSASHYFACSACCKPKKCGSAWNRFLRDTESGEDIKFAFAKK